MNWLWLVWLLPSTFIWQYCATFHDVMALERRFTFARAAFDFEWNGMERQPAQRKCRLCHRRRRRLRHLLGSSLIKLDSIPTLLHLFKIFFPSKIIYQTETMYPAQCSVITWWTIQTVRYLWSKWNESHCCAGRWEENCRQRASLVRIWLLAKQPSPSSSSPYALQSFSFSLISIMVLWITFASRRINHRFFLIRPWIIASHFYSPSAFLSHLFCWQFACQVLTSEHAHASQ